MARPKFEGSKPDKEPKGLKEGSPAEEKMDRAQRKKAAPAKTVGKKPAKR